MKLSDALLNSTVSQEFQRVKGAMSWTFDVFGAIALETGMDMTDETNFLNHNGKRDVNLMALRAHFKSIGFDLDAKYPTPQPVQAWGLTEKQTCLWNILVILNDHLRYTFGQIAEVLREMGL